MRSIGIVSDESAEQILELLNRAEGRKDISVAVYPAHRKGSEDLDMLIINSYRDGLAELLKNLSPKALALINSDEKRLNGEMLNFKGRVISYGFNQKACITASSVDQEEFTTIQCCIQRSLPTFSDGVIEEQEFSVCSPVPNAGPGAILAYAAAAAISDLPLGGITRGSQPM